jgi:hypothetical protein
MNVTTPIQKDKLFHFFAILVLVVNFDRFLNAALVLELRQNMFLAGFSILLSNYYCSIFLHIIPFETTKFFYFFAFSDL